MEYSVRQNKLVIFDWGGVIESHNQEEHCISKATIAFFKSFGVDLDDETIVEKYLECCNHVDNSDDTNELFNKLKNIFNIECTMDEFIKRYNEYTSKTHFYKEVVDYAHSLKNKCKIGILSNLNPFDKTRINYQMDLKKFDYVWLSFELNCRKPDPKIYNIVEKDLSIPSKNILFIDDLEKNLEIPKMKGWNVCQAVGTDLDKIKQCVEEFLKDETNG